MKTAIASDRRISRFEIVDHGIDGCQYFRGCGVSHTEFEDCATGCGDTFAEALEDARDQIAQGGWIETKGQRKALDRAAADADESVSVSGMIREADLEEEYSETYYYVLIRVR